MRKFTKIESDVLNTINDTSNEAAISIDKIINTLIQERDTGANSKAEMTRIDELRLTYCNLHNVSICINNAS